MFLSFPSIISFGDRFETSDKGQIDDHRKTNPIETVGAEVDDSDESSSLSSLSRSDGSHGDRLDGSDEEKEDEDYDVVQMTDKEARRMFDDEVTFSCSSICI